MKNTYKILVRKPERMRSLERSQHRWEVTIKIYLKETGCKDVD
jgi:hypothetical protein